MVERGARANFIRDFDNLRVVEDFVEQEILQLRTDIVLHAKNFRIVHSEKVNVIGA